MLPGNQELGNSFQPEKSPYAHRGIHHLEMCSGILEEGSSIWGKSSEHLFPICLGICDIQTNITYWLWQQFMIGIRQQSHINAPHTNSITHGNDLSNTCFSQGWGAPSSTISMLMALANTAAWTVVLGSSSRIARFRIPHNSVPPCRLALVPVMQWNQQQHTNWWVNRHSMYPNMFFIAYYYNPIM